MITIEKLIDILKKYPKDFEVVNEQNEEYIHIINTNDNRLRLSTKKPIGICNRSGGYVYPSITEGYEGFSPELNEDLYKFEFTEDMSCTEE